MRLRRLLVAALGLSAAGLAVATDSTGSAGSAEAPAAATSVPASASAPGPGPASALPAASPETATRPPAALANAFDSIRRRARRSLVQVVGLRSHANLREDASGARRPLASVATGVILDASGHVVTTASAVEQCDAVSVRLADGREARAMLLGVDTISDVALLRVSLRGLEGVPLAGSATGLEGAWVVTLAETRDRHPDHSFGTVRRRYDQPLSSLLMMTNAAYPGYSGGAALNPRGELVGLVVGRLDHLPDDWSDPDEARGPATFAVAADDLRDIVDELRRFGRVRRGYLGVRMVQGEVVDANAPDEPFRIGVRVEAVLPGSPAAQVGLRPGDLIVGWNGETLQSPEDLMRRVESMRPGESSVLVWVRDEERREGRLVVAAKPDEEFLAGGEAEAVRTRTDPEADRLDALNRRLDRLRSLRSLQQQAPAPGTIPTPHEGTTPH